MWIDPEYECKFWKKHDPKDVLCSDEYELLKLVRKKFGKYAYGERFYKGCTETGFEFFVSDDYGKEVWNKEKFERAKAIIDSSSNYLEYRDKALAFSSEMVKGHKYIGGWI